MIYLTLEWLKYILKKTWVFFFLAGNLFSDHHAGYFLEAFSVRITKMFIDVNNNLAKKPQYALCQRSNVHLSMLFFLQVNRLHIYYAFQRKNESKKCCGFNLEHLNNSLLTITLTIKKNF